MDSLHICTPVWPVTGKSQVSKELPIGLHGLGMLGKQILRVQQGDFDVLSIIVP